jgi:MIP family channel proteins
MQIDDFRRYACEFIGTFTLVVFAAGAVMVDAMTGGSLGPVGYGSASGIVLMAIIFTFAHVSGAHVNPALSVAAVYLGLLPGRLLGGYLLAQVGGSVVAGLLLLLTFGAHGQMGANLPNLSIGIGPTQAFAIEVFLSFVLMTVIIFCISSSKRVADLAAIPIGAVVGIEVMVMGPVAGAAMNPARALGPYVALGDYTYLWIYVAGPLAGMMLGAAVFRLIKVPESELAPPVSAPVTSKKDR